MPSDLFGCQNKQKSREDIWRIISSFHHPPLSKILLFPGSKRYELDVVLKRGFRPENIFLVEKNIAVKANFTRTARGNVLPPRENFYRMLLSDTIPLLLERNVALDAAHLDFCSNCDSNEVFTETRAFLRSGVLKPKGHVCITTLRGREHDIVNIRGLDFLWTTQGASSSFKQFSPGDRGRFYRLWSLLGRKLQITNTGEYYNTKSNTNMLWAIFRVDALGGGNL